MMGTIRQIKPASFPPPAFKTTSQATGTSAVPTATRTSNRNSASNALSKCSANVTSKATDTTTTTATYITKTTEARTKDTLSNALQQKYTTNQHLHLSANNSHSHSNSHSNSRSMPLWQVIKSDAASLLPLVAFLLLLSCTATPTLATPVFVDNPSLAQCE
ncbi:PREDICTED: uncharacterized protein LOC108379371 [Rhagoletis zephyria]|uniref:uncharacterized protein LOC108379371 n=1 Tax=Rhagoletis zephyria TaxID=28612 RepID=UPI00081160F0|nr:PREDICTED: uncharacterized protein LOC108379371 [Rhagoletis zephyria]